MDLLGRNGILDSLDRAERHVARGIEAGWGSIEHSPCSPVLHLVDLNLSSMYDRELVVFGQSDDTPERRNDIDGNAKIYTHNTRCR
jgi:hypothetical protein